MNTKNPFRALSKRRLWTPNVNQRLASNFIWELINKLVQKGVFFCVNIYLARKLGVANFGLFVFAQTITWYFWLAVDLGTNMYGIREVAKNKNNSQKIVNSLIAMRFTTGLLVFSIYIISTLIFSISPAQRLVFWGCGLYLITFAFYNDWILKGLEKFQYNVLGGIGSSLIYLAGVLLFVRNEENVLQASLSWSVSFLVGSVILTYIIFSKLNIILRPSFKIKEWIFHLKESIFFTTAGILNAFFRYLPILLIKTFLSTYEVGLFSAPFKIIITISGAGIILTTASYPVLSELFKKNKKKFLKTYKRLSIILILLSLPLTILGTIFSDKIVYFLLGADYSQSSSLFMILIWLFPLELIRSINASILMASGHQREQNIAYSIGAACMIVFGVFLISRYGIIGGAWAMFSAEVLMVGSMLMIVRIMNRRWIKKEWN